MMCRFENFFFTCVSQLQNKISTALKENMTISLSAFCSAIITVTHHQETGTVFTYDDLDRDPRVIADADG